MITSDVGAYQEMCARMRETADLPSVHALVGYAPEVRYDGVVYSKEDRDRVVKKYWLRFTTVSSGEKRRTMGARKRITYHGTAVAQLFIPKLDRTAAGTGYNLAEVVKSAYASSTASVDFYRSMIRD